MVYLVVLDGSAEAQRVADHFDEAKALWNGVVAVESEQTQSQVYHAVKRLLKRPDRLLVARLESQPKFKGAAEGSLTWMRGQYGAP